MNENPEAIRGFFVPHKEFRMAKPNYSFEKRKKELDRKRKQEEKQQRKQDKDSATEPDQDEDAAKE